MLEKLGRKARGRRGVRMRARRHVPVLGLVLYYGILVTTGLLLIRFVPGADAAITAPIAPSSAADIFGTTGASAAPVPESPWGGPFGRLALTLFATFGAVALALPVAGIYMHTRRLRYDSSLVQTMIVLPIVVAGVVLVVKNSLALAFALAGIVAGVRFRQKLNEPKDAVYVLLSLGLGLAAAVHALDIALALSLSFNVVVLTLWRFEPGGVGGTGVTLSMGDTELIRGRTRLTEARAIADGRDMETDGLLIVYAPNVDEAHQAVELSLNGIAKEWFITESRTVDGGMQRFEVLLQLKGSGDPVDLMADLEERWAAQIAAAEYVPFRHRTEDDDDDDD